MNKTKIIKTIGAIAVTLVVRSVGDRVLDKISDSAVKKILK